LVPTPTVGNRETGNPDSWRKSGIGNSRPHFGDFRARMFWGVSGSFRKVREKSGKIRKFREISEILGRFQQKIGQNRVKFSASGRRGLPTGGTQETSRASSPRCTLLLMASPRFSRCTNLGPSTLPTGPHRHTHLPGRVADSDSPVVVSAAWRATSQKTNPSLRTPLSLRSPILDSKSGENHFGSG
jgi:hypothetical protein